MYVHVSRFNGRFSLDIYEMMEEKLGVLQETRCSLDELGELTTTGAITRHVTLHADGTNDRIATTTETRVFALSATAANTKATCIGTVG